LWNKRKTGGKMKERSLLRFFLYISVLSVILYGCGSGAGAPGSKGTEDTGVIVDTHIEGLYLNELTYSVDTFRQVCDEGPPEVLEFMGDHQAEVTFTASLINPNSTIKPGTIYIDKYTIEYKRSNDSIGAPPIEKDTRYKSITITPPLSGTGTTTITTNVLLVDLTRKEQYYDDMVSGRYNYQAFYINNYTAIYTFYGKNDYGENFSVKAQMDFQIGSFDNCD
jgi:hypothetical protein